MRIVVHQNVKTVARLARVANRRPPGARTVGLQRVGARVPVVKIADDADKGLVGCAQHKSDSAGPHQVNVRAAADIGRQPLARVGAAEEVVKL